MTHTNNQTIYQQNGFADRKEYLEYLAHDYWVDINHVLALAEILGPEEDFDGLIVALDREDP